MCIESTQKRNVINIQKTTAVKVTVEVNVAVTKPVRTQLVRRELY